MRTSLIKVGTIVEPTLREIKAAAVALACPVLRLETKLRNNGLLPDDFDLVGFCVERIPQLLG